MRNAKMPFVDEGHCITKAQQAFVSIHGAIPCNLAPAHFTVTVLDKKDGRETVISVIYKKGVIVLFLLNCIFSKVFKC